MSLPPEITFTTPGGNTLFAGSPIFNTHRGVYGDGFTTTVLPVKTAGAIFHTVKRTGKFQGVIVPTTPKGRYSV